MTEQEYEQRLEKEITEVTERYERILDTVIIGLASVVESRDNSTGHHVKRTSEGVRAFMKILKDDPDYQVDEKFCRSISKAAPMHDLGKLSVPDAILQKPGSFTEEDYRQMKKHSQSGAMLVFEVLSEILDPDFVKIAINVAHYHHEKWDGTGYPSGLKGEMIPFEARVMALADVFDALVSKRCYKDQFSYDEAFNIIESSLGTHFDPVLGQKFIEHRSTFEALYDRLLSEDNA